ncbi:MAG TPA: Npt1/Npt2 family nucleotide transporter [Polyangiaceae bacterium]|nr:Npt1/Npt2 family nucleotide transporter [Polyangiaceae bacterium]
MSFLAIRKGERRHAWTSFATLFALIASHSILETARDALFLAKVPAARLPWVFLAIAAVSLALVKGQARVTRGLRPERALSVAALLASLGTLGFFWFLPGLGTWGVYALYVWSGVLVTLVLGYFWAVVSDLFTITQAKRLYGFVGAGSVLGAIAGSGAAGLLSKELGPERLLLLSAVGFGTAALIPALFAANATAGRSVDAAPRLLDTIALVGRDAYAARIAASLFIATVCLTIADYVFKSTVAAHVPGAALGTFLGSVYFAVNLLSLVCQVGLVGRILRRVSLGGALAILPALLVVGGLGVAATGALSAVLAMKAADGALRYSLHRTAAELLLVPFGDETRRRIKAFVDVVSQRGGQVFASVMILAFTAAGARPRVIAVTLAVLAVCWVASALSLRKPYVELFRSRLNAGRLSHATGFPELDVASLETLIGALESENNAEVIAALGVLEREGKAHLVPAFILYHPDEQVVLRALELLTRSGRKNAVSIVERLLDHPSSAVRASAIAARSVLAPDPATLKARLDVEESPEVRATIVVNLIASGDISARERTEHLDAILREGSMTTKVALADAIGRRRAAGFESVLWALSSSREPETRRAAIAAMGQVGSAALMPVAVAALTDESSRAEAEKVLANNGVEAFRALLERFEDRRTDPALRWRIPPAMALASPEQALTALLDLLPREANGKVRFQLIRTLERLVRQHPTLPVNRASLDRAIDETVALAFTYLDARRLLVRGAEKVEARKTKGHELLCDLLRDKEANTGDRLFRLLGLLHPSEDFGQIHRGLAGTREQRATSIELIESIVREPLRSAVLGLVDDGDDARRLARAGRYHRAVTGDYAALLALLAASDSDALCEVTCFHAAELGIALQSRAQGKAA